MDIDGVLNCKTSRSRCGKYVGIDDDKLATLKRIADATGGEVVLVSTWKQSWQKLERDKYKQDAQANYLDKKFKKHDLKVCDKTSDSLDGVYFGRGESISEFIYRNKVTGYVILDDFQYDYDGCGLTDHLVTTNHAAGLTPENAARAIRILNGA